MFDDLRRAHEERQQTAALEGDRDALTPAVQYRIPSPSTTSWLTKATRWVSRLSNTHEQPRANDEQAIRLVCISDTHGQHRSLTVPDGDVLVHAGDLTRYGTKQDVEDFSDWFSNLPHPHKVFVQGNHECNSEWIGDMQQIVKEAVYLEDSATTFHVQVGDRTFPVVFHGTRFSWSCRGHNPAYDLVSEDVDVLVSHMPCHGAVDDGAGCPELLRHVSRTRPRLFICGHEHHARGILNTDDTTFVNAANCGHRHRIAHDPMVIELPVSHLKHQSAR